MTLDWLLHNYQRKLMETLYENPLQSFCLSELAHLSGVDPGNTKRYLEKFAERKIIRLEKSGFKTKVCADLTNPETRKIFELFELARTARFLEALKVRRSHIETFVNKMIETLPDVRLIAMYDIKENLVDQNKLVNLAIVVGSMRDITVVHERVQSIINTSNLIHEFNICVYSCDNLASAWNSEACGCLGFWSDRAVLYGEGYYWDMVARQACADPGDRYEEMVQNA